MLRRTRRPVSLLAPLLLAGALAACGDEGGGSASSGDLERLDALTISGDVGSEPKVEWKGRMSAGAVEAETLTEGDGEAIDAGDSVLTHIWIGNGYTEREAYSSYEAQPEQILVSDDLAPVFGDAFTDQKIGARVAVTASADEAFGEAGNPQLNIGNKDSVVVVMDFVDMYVPPKPRDVPASQLPGIVSEGGEPVSLDFSAVPKPRPDGDLLRSVLEKGTGEKVTADMTVTADYLGMVHGAKKPFDESFSKEPAEFALTGVVQGWSLGLTGVNVGSRVLLQIPPELGYGDQAQAGIPANSTLYFVVDIVAAK